MRDPDRWLDDPYARMWSTYATVASIAMPQNVVNWSVELPEGACSTHNKVPREVMQTAIMASNITYTIPDVLPERLVYGILYFCELNVSAYSKQRSYSCYLEHPLSVDGSDPPFSKGPQRNSNV